jgi:hypothetical protein
LTHYRSKAHKMAHEKYIGYLNLMQLLMIILISG